MFNVMGFQRNAIKTIPRYYFTSIRVAIVKVNKTVIGKDVEKWEQICWRLGLQSPASREGWEINPVCGVQLQQPEQSETVMVKLVQTEYSNGNLHIYHKMPALQLNLVAQLLGRRCGNWTGVDREGSVYLLRHACRECTASGLGQ